MSWNSKYVQLNIDIAARQRRLDMSHSRGNHIVPCHSAVTLSRGHLGLIARRLELEPPPVEQSKISLSYALIVPIISSL